MASTFIPAAEIGKHVWDIFDKVCNEQGLDEKQRVEVLNVFSAQMFQGNPTPKEPKNGED
jgi:hypothetical protein